MPGIESTPILRLGSGLPAENKGGAPKRAAQILICQLRLQDEATCPASRTNPH
jgi:hypothetical protein